MPRRRSSDNLDSLELLLDTICNTFGGVLFMAMLICLLSNKATTVTNEAKVDPNAQARSQLATLDQIEQRERTVATAELNLTKAAIEHEAAEQAVQKLGEAAHWNAASARSAAIQLADQADAVREAVRTQDVLAELNQQLDQRRQQIAAAAAELQQRQQEVHSLDSAIKAKREQNQIHLRVPSAHETQKRQQVAYVARGRLFSGVYPDERYRLTAPIFRGSVKTSSDKSLSPADLPDSLGSSVIATPEQAKQAVHDQGLDTLDPTRDYVIFAVWPDSFEEFRRLRDAVTTRGLGYGLLLMSKDEPVSFGGSKSIEQ